MLVMVAVVAPPLVGHVGPPLGVFAGLQLLAASLAGLRGGAGAAQAPPAPMKSPFELVTVLKFAVLLGVIMAAAKALSAIYGAAGLLPVLTRECKPADLEAAQLGFDRAQTAVVEITVDLAGQLRPGGIDQDGVVEAPDQRHAVRNQAVIAVHVVHHHTGRLDGFAGRLPGRVGDHPVDRAGQLQALIDARQTPVVG